MGFTHDLPMTNDETNSHFPWTHERISGNEIVMSLANTCASYHEHLDFSIKIPDLMMNILDLSDLRTKTVTSQQQYMVIEKRRKSDFSSTKISLDHTIKLCDVTIKG